KSVHVTLLPSYLSTLSAGTHMLTILFDDADDVNIPFGIKEAAPSQAPTPGPSPAPGPNTGDATNYTIWIILMAVTLAVIIAAIVLLVHKRKRIRK
ncbi:MAG: LPXTG cell wall anchor domain-containing protein, partial [Parasporobacterium sp.]|nr:LPXTG cell wall anchor domain-containing protein [Parasporobacterium sp.]